MNRTPPTRGDLSGIVLTKAPKRSLVADITARPATDEHDQEMLEHRAQAPETAQQTEAAAGSTPSPHQAPAGPSAPEGTAQAAPPSVQAPVAAAPAEPAPGAEQSAPAELLQAPAAPPAQSARVLADSLPGRSQQEATPAPAPQPEPAAVQPAVTPPLAAPQAAQQEPPARKRVADTKMKQTIRMDEADNKRAKRAFNATRHLHGIRNWEDFVARALMNEVLHLEEKYNEGQEFHATEELPKGRPLNM